MSAIWWALLDYASKIDDRGSIAGFDPELLASFYEFDEAMIARVLAALTDKGLIVADRIASWERRQTRREDYSTPRVQRFRERQRQSETPRNADETPRNAPDSEEIQIREERAPPKAPPIEAGAPAGAALSQEDLPIDLPEDLRAKATEARRQGKLPAVNLDAEWTKFRRQDRQRWPLSRWVDWGLIARASLAGNGAAEPAPAEPTSPPAPIAHRLGPRGDQLRAAVDPAPFGAWLADLDFVGLRDGRLALSAPTKFCRQMALQEFEPAICRAWGARSLEILVREAPQAPAEPRAGKLSRKRVRGKPPRPEQREIMMPIAGGAVADEAAAGLELDRQRGAA